MQVKVRIRLDPHKPNKCTNNYTKSDETWLDQIESLESIKNFELCKKWHRFRPRIMDKAFLVVVISIESGFTKDGTETES